MRMYLIGYTFTNCIMPQEADDFEYICRLDEIEVGSKRCFYLPSSQRSVLLIHLRQGEVFCIDQTCYRKCISQSYTYYPML